MKVHGRNGWQWICAEGPIGHLGRFLGKILVMDLLMNGRGTRAEFRSRLSIARLRRLAGPPVDIYGGNALELGWEDI